MSTTVDQRVVEMQFDNRHFETNVSTTMSSLDKLNSKLNLTGATKGLENVDAAAKKVDMNGLGAGVETVRAKFSAMEVIGVTALANITNSAVNAGKRIVSALTIDPVKSGFNEYEMKMDSVKTIMASTGESVETVNKYLNELNEYSDQTIYSFADMTQNIGKFTNAGVKLQDAVLAIKGISNEAAVSGANANEASRAMYNFAQALSSGYVKLIDWKSIELANMATVEFKDQLIQTAVELGTVVKEGDKYRSTTTDMKGKTSELFTTTSMFNDSLSAQWMTTEVLVKTLGKYADSTTDIGKKAYAAAQEVTKLTQMWDVMKETAQSGWARTWELLIGDINQAKAIFTPLTNFFTKFIDSMSDFRNRVIEIALNFKAPWDAIMEKLTSSGFGKVKEFAETIVDAADKVAYFQDIVTRVWMGEFNNWGDNPDRRDLLTAAGYDHRVVQDLVNKGFQYQITIDDVKAAHEKFGLTLETTTTVTETVAESVEELTKEQLKNAGLTEEEIELYIALQKEAGRLGISVEELAKKMSETSGRTLLVDSFKNIGKGLLNFFKTIKDAWVEIFEPPNSSELGIRLYGIITALNEFTKKLTLTDEKTGELNDTAKKLKRTFKGIFAVIDIISTVVGGAFKIAFKIVKGILSYFNIDILDLTANIGDMLVRFRDWTDRVFDITKALDVIVPFIKRAIDAIGDWINTLRKSDNIPRDIILGLVNGLKNGIPKVISAAIELGKTILEWVKGVLGIHSPSTEFFEVGKNIIQGLVNGIKDCAIMVWDVIKSVVFKVVDFLKGVDFGTLFAAGMGVGLLVVVNKIADALSVFSGMGSMFEGIGDMCEDIGRGFKKLSKSASLWMTSKAIQNIAIAVAILAGSVALLSILDTKKMWSSIGAIAVLAAVLAGLIIVLGKFGPKEAIGFGKYAVMLLGIAASLLIVALTMKLLSGISDKGMSKAKSAMFAIVAMFTGLMAATKLLGKDVDSISKVFLKISIAMLLLVFVGKLIAKMSWSDMGKAAAGLLGLTGIIALLMVIGMIPGKTIDNLGKVILKISIAMLLLVFVGKTIAKMSWGDMEKAAVGLAGLVGIMALLMLVGMIPGTNIDKVSSMLLKVAGAMLILSIVSKIIQGMSWGDMAKTAVGLAGLVGIIALLVLSTKLVSEKDLAKVGTTVLMMAVAIGIMAAVAALLGFLSIEHLAKGVIAVSILGAIIALMVYATKGAQECKGNIVAMAVVIAVLAASLIALSFIDFDKIAVATVAMGALMALFALIVHTTKTANKCTGTLIIIGLIIVALGGVLYLLASLPIKSTIAAAASLAIMLVAVAAVVKLLSTMGINIGGAIMGALSLLIMAIPLLAFVGILHLMSGVKDAIPNATALCELAVVMTALLIPLIAIGAAIVPTLIGILALTAMAIPLLVFIELIKSMSGIKDAEKNIGLILGLMAPLMGMLVVLAVIGPAALVGVGALAALTAVIVAVGALAVGIGALMESFPALKRFLDTGIPILEQLAEAVGRMIGKFITGLVTEITSALPQIGTDLSEFMINVTPFVEGAKKVDDRVTTGVGILAKSILALALAEIVDAVANFVSGGTTLAEIGADLSTFMTNVMPFVMGARLIDPTVFKGVDALVDTFKLLTGAEVIDALASFITGGTSLADFGRELAEFAPYLAEYSRVIADVDPAAVEASANAGKALSQLATTLPNSGGVVSWFTGDNDISTFGEQLVIFGNGIKSYADSVAGIDIESMRVATEAGKSLVELANTIPDLGGMVTWFTGDNDIGTFGKQLVTFGNGLREYGIAVTGMNIEAIDASIYGGRGLAEMAALIPDLGGMVTWFTGDNDLATFGSHLESFGKSLKAYSVAVTGMDADAVDKSIPGAKGLAELSGSVEDIGGVVSWFAGDNDLTTFGTQIVAFGGALKDYSKSVSGLRIEGIMSSVRAAQALVDIQGSLGASGGVVAWWCGEQDIETFGNNVLAFGNSMRDYAAAVVNIDFARMDKATIQFRKLFKLVHEMESVDLDNVSFFADRFGNYSTTGIQIFISKFEESYDLVTAAARDWIMKFVEAIEGKINAVKSVANELAYKAAQATKTKYGTFHGAGKYLAIGFANGIKDNTYQAEAKAAAMAKAAAEAAKEELDINSPSKVFRAIGESIPEGFAMGIERLSGLVTGSSVNMADTALGTVKASISRIADMMNADIDSQPTIRPVLDLSDVESGTSALSNMLNMRSSVGVLANVNGISSMMNQRSQNGVNAEVVSAINRLRKDLSNIGNNTTIVDGVTYDDGSNVHGAVGELVRAIRMGRRT